MPLRRRQRSPHVACTSSSAPEDERRNEALPLDCCEEQHFSTQARSDGQGHRRTDRQRRRVAADEKGGIEFFVNATWINEVDTEQLRMLSSVSAIVFGAKTYRMFADYWPYVDPAIEPAAVPINSLPKFVVSSTLESAPWGSHVSAKILRGDGIAAVQDLRSRFGGDLIVWGSLSLSDALLRSGEVDVIRLRMLPVLLGHGRSFAPSDLGVCQLSLVSTKAFAGGPVLLEYSVARHPEAASSAAGAVTISRNADNRTRTR
jgi:dihydrofolate reductase